MNPIILIACALFFISNVYAGDLLREKEIRSHLEKNIKNSLVVDLKTSNQTFLGLFGRTNITQAKGAAVILHDLDANPDWTQVIRPLRKYLPEHGWETIAIQLPLPFSGDDERDHKALIQESMPRIESALSFLESQGLFNNVLVAHGFGARIASEYLAQKDSEGVQAFVGISMSGPDTRDAIKKIKIPILDIWGERDYRHVLQSAREKRLAAKDASNEKFEQAEIAVANHYFDGMQTQLTSRVRAWLNKVASGIEIER